ncbi:replication initiator protein A [Tautonia marina]|uniref:replication initiator protein A n=1 Tax=Tautonia marina TaxID=2653855 RepID=UPI00137612A1|nr:replication initiator protein A [Tautonia marina]
MNLAEFPITLLSDRAPEGMKTLVFKDQNGTLTITGSDAYGLPTAADSDVIVALMYLTKRQTGFRRDGDNSRQIKVYFTRYELLKLLRWPDTKTYYRRLDESLTRWQGVQLLYDRCWYDRQHNIHTSAKIHILESVIIVDNDARKKARARGQTELPLSFFVWNGIFLESCLAGNLRELNLDEYFALNSSISKRLYRFLGKRFYLRPDWTFDLHEIAFDRVGLSRNYKDASKLREKLSGAIAELEAIGFLKPLSREQRYQKQARGKWTIRFVHQGGKPLAAPAAEPPPAPPPAADPLPPLAQELIACGVTEATARELAGQHPAEHIEAKLDILRWLTERKDKRVAKSPGGYLVESIRRNYATPAGYQPPEERRRIEEKQKLQARKAEEELRRRQETRERELAESDAVTAYLKGLSPEQLEAHDARSREEAPEEDLALERGNHALARLARTNRHRQYALKLLKEQGRLP